MVARAVGAGIVENRGDNGSVEYAYYAGPPWSGIEFFVADRALVGVFPTHDGQACVWIGSPYRDAHAARRRAASRTAAWAAPNLAARLHTGRRMSAVTGMLRMPNRLRRAYGPGWALVGDSGYHRDAITGYGLSDAYRDAELLAVALDQALRRDADEATALATYEQRRDEALRDVFDLTCALADYPAAPEFVERQKQLSRAIDVEAARLADLPIPGQREPACT